MIQSDSDNVAIKANNFTCPSEGDILSQTTQRLFVQSRYSDTVGHRSKKKHNQLRPFCTSSSQKGQTIEVHHDISSSVPRQSRPFGGSLAVRAVIHSMHPILNLTFQSRAQRGLPCGIKTNHMATAQESRPCSQCCGLTVVPKANETSESNQKLTPHLIRFVSFWSCERALEG